jgi:hypothetical protein
MRDMLILSAALLLQGTLGFYVGRRTEREHEKRTRERESNARCDRLMRDIWAPPTPRNAPLSFRAGNDSTAANLLIADAGGRAPRGEE